VTDEKEREAAVESQTARINGGDMSDVRMLDVYLPGFTGFSAPGWAALVSGPRRSAAQRYALSEPKENPSRLDAEEFAEILENVADRQKQYSVLAGGFYTVFAIKLALKVGFPHGLLFKELQLAADHGLETDRILATLPVPSAGKLFELSEAGDHDALDDVMGNDFPPYLGCMPDPEEDCRSLLAFLPIEDWDARALGTLLRAFVGPRVEEVALRKVAGNLAETAFSVSIDRARFADMARSRRREKVPSARSHRI
jgi:hypothetical protein